MFHKKVRYNEEYEVCISCGAQTNIPKSRPLELRSDYLPGAGQLCHECAVQNVDEEQEAMSNGYVYTLPVYKKRDRVNKRLKGSIRHGIASLFTRIADPVHLLSELDNVDRGPTPEEIDKANQLAEELSREQSK